MTAHFSIYSELRRLSYTLLTKLAMASQPVAADTSCVEIELFIRGYHAYQDVWEPSVGEVLLLQREPTNFKDSQAVAIMKSTLIVGHVPASLSALFSHFLSRTCNKATVEITGSKVNRGAGYGLEIPCKYRLYGPKAYLERLEKIITNQRLQTAKK